MEKRGSDGAGSAALGVVAFCFAFSYRARLGQAENKKDASARGPSTAQFKGCARGQREFVHPGSSPSSPGLVWARRAPLMLMMRALAVRIMRSRSRAEAASSNLLALHRAVQKPAPMPHGTRARFAAIHRLIPRRGAHHEHQRDPRDAAEEGRRRWRASVSLKLFAFRARASPARASPSSGGPRPRPQKGPAALPD